MDCIFVGACFLSASGNCFEHITTCVLMGLSPWRQGSVFTISLFMWVWKLKRCSSCGLDDCDQTTAGVIIFRNRTSSRAPVKPYLYVISRKTEKNLSNFERNMLRTQYPCLRKMDHEHKNVPRLPTVKVVVEGREEHSSCSYKNIQMQHGSHRRPLTMTRHVFRHSGMRSRETACQGEETDGS